MKLTSKDISILVFLYDSLEFDGRAQRSIDVIRQFGSVTLVDLINRTISTDNCSNFNIKRIKVDLSGNIGKISRHLRFWRTAFRVAWQAQPNVIVAENFFTSFAGWLASRLVGSKLIYDAYELIIPEVDKQMTPRDRFWYLLERWTVKRADLIIAANKDRACLMAEHYSLKHIPTAVRNIPHRQVVLNTINKSEKIVAQHPFLNKRNNDDRLIIYQGDITMDRRIGLFIQSLAYLPKNYRFVLVGGGVDLEQIKNLAKDYEKQGRFIYMGRVKHQELQAITAIADVGIISYPHMGQNNIYCSPNKIFEYAQAGLPVVSSNQPPLKRMVEAYGLGELVDESADPQHVAVAIQQVAENKELFTSALVRFLNDHKWDDEASILAKDVKKVLDHD